MPPLSPLFAAVTPLAETQCRANTRTLVFTTFRALEHSVPGLPDYVPLSYPEQRAAMPVAAALFQLYFLLPATASVLVT